MILRSCDGVDFRADSAVLNRASPVFEDMAKLSSPQNEPLAPPVLAMEETSDVLDILLCLLYPIESPPQITSTSQGRELLRLVDKLQITHFVVLQALETYIGTVKPPLVAWAMTMTSSFPSLRRAGVRRESIKFDTPADVPEEMRDVSAHAVFTLLALKKEAMGKAENYLSIFHFAWACDLGSGTFLGVPNTPARIIIKPLSHSWCTKHITFMQGIIRACDARFLPVFVQFEAKRAQTRRIIEQLLDVENAS